MKATVTPEIAATAAEMANKALSTLAARKAKKPAVVEATKVKVTKSHTTLAPKAEVEPTATPKPEPKVKAPKAPKAPVADPSRTTLQALSRRMTAAGIDCQVHGQNGHIFFENAQRGAVELDIHRVNAKSVSEWMKLAEDWATTTPATESE